MCILCVLIAEFDLHAMHSHHKSCHDNSHKTDQGYSSSGFIRDVVISVEEVKLQNEKHQD